MTALRQRGSWRGENVHVTHAGRELYVESSVAVSCADDGSPRGLIAVIRDITERKQIDQARRENGLRMRLATEATSVGIWEWNVHTGEVRWDDVMFQIYGIAPTADGVVHYRDFAQAILPEDFPAQDEILQDTARRAGSSRRDFRIRRRSDGECRNIEAVETARTNENGETEWVLGTNLDVTDRKRAEEALRTSEEHYRTATAAVSDVLWTNSADGLMTGDQPGWQGFTGQSPDEYQGYGWSKAVHPDDAQPTLDAWTRAVAEKRTFVFEHRVRRRDGEWRVCSIRAVPILHADGMIREWVGVPDAPHRFCGHSRWPACRAALCR